MCTVTIIPLRRPSGFRLACNRDELRARPAATPPSLRRFGNRVAALPTDPLGGGTWVAVNDAGLAFALLNVNPAGAPAAELSPNLRSRGLIIPAVLHCGDTDEVLAAVTVIDPRIYPPFRLVVASRGACVEVASDGRQLRTRTTPLRRPLIFTSSGLGDAVVDRPRRTLFGRLIAPHSAAPADQDAFHSHRWPDRPHLSVCMARADAHTVSYTAIRVTPATAALHYLAGGPRSTASPSRVRFDLAPTADPHETCR